MSVVFKYPYWDDDGEGDCASCLEQTPSQLKSSSNLDTVTTEYQVNFQVSHSVLSGIPHLSAGFESDSGPFLPQSKFCKAKFGPL